MVRLQVVEKALQRSMSRMRVETLDCVQFHWWDYKDKRYLDALGHLSDLQQEGVIRMCTFILYAFNTPDSRIQAAQNIKEKEKRNKGNFCLVRSYNPRSCVLLILQVSSLSPTLTHRDWRRSPTKGFASQATR